MRVDSPVAVEDGVSPIQLDGPGVAGQSFVELVTFHQVVPLQSHPDISVRRRDDGRRSQQQA